MFPGLQISPENRHIMNRSYRRTRGFISQAPVGGGKKTRAIFPVSGKPGVFKKMPEGIGGSGIDKALGDKFHIRNGLAESETIELPAE
jgi:hypothetical protein